MTAGVISGFGLIVVGLVVWSLTVAAASGKVERNGLVGIRTKATLASDEAWHAGHLAALSGVRRIGYMSLVVGFAMLIEALLLDDGAGSMLFWVLFVFGYGWLLVDMLIVTTQANRAARAALGG